MKINWRGCGAVGAEDLFLFFLRTGSQFVAKCSIWQALTTPAEISLAAAGFSTELQVDPRWDEYDHLNLVHHHVADRKLDAPVDPRGFQALLEEVLRLIEKSDTERRNPEKYYFTIFGTPAENGTWGYRIEGHHVAQNFTIVNGKVIGGPSFFGSNPAEL